MLLRTFVDIFSVKFIQHFITYEQKTCQVNNSESMQISRNIAKINQCGRHLPYLRVNSTKIFKMINKMWQFSDSVDSFTSDAVGPSHCTGATAEYADFTHLQINFD